MGKVNLNRIDNDLDLLYWCYYDSQLDEDYSYRQVEYDIEPKSGKVNWERYRKLSSIRNDAIDSLYKEEHSDKNVIKHYWPK